MRRVFGTAALILFAALLVSACGSAVRSEPAREREVAAGSVVTTPAGIRLTVPPGARARVVRPSRDQVGRYVPATHIVDIETDEWSVSVMSFERNDPNPLTSVVVASSEESRVVVYEPSARGLPAAVETRLPGAAPGRLAIALTRDGELKLRGLAMAKYVWRELHVEGTSLPLEASR